MVAFSNGVNLQLLVMLQRKILVYVLISLIFSFNFPASGKAKTKHSYICPCKSTPCCCKIKTTGKICMMGMMSQKKNKTSEPIGTALILNAQCGAPSKKAFLLSHLRLFILPKKESLAVNNDFCYLYVAKEMRSKEVFLSQPKKPPRPYPPPLFS
jgi:hypothetical protein